MILLIDCLLIVYSLTYWHQVDRIDKEVQTILPHHTHDENTKEHHQTGDMIENMYARNKACIHCTFDAYSKQ